MILSVSLELHILSERMRHMVVVLPVYFLPIPKG